MALRGSSAITQMPRRWSTASGRSAGAVMHWDVRIEHRAPGLQKQNRFTGRNPVQQAASNSTSSLSWSFGGLVRNKVKRTGNGAGGDLRILP